MLQKFIYRFSSVATRVPTRWCRAERSMITEFSDTGILKENMITPSPEWSTNLRILCSFFTTSIFRLLFLVSIFFLKWFNNSAISSFSLYIMIGSFRIRLVSSNKDSLPRRWSGMKIFLSRLALISFINLKYLLIRMGLIH